MLCYTLFLLVFTTDLSLQPTFYALYRSFTQCLFIEEEEDIAFYKNKDGVAVREVQRSALKESQASDDDLKGSDAKTS